MLPDIAASRPGVQVIYWYADPGLVPHSIGR